MAPKAPDPDEEDGLPESSDDEERPPVRVPPVKNLPRGGEDASAPLLPPAAAPSDSKPMLSPRDKFRNKSKSTTPREHDAVSDAKAAASEFASGVGSELSGARLPSKEEREGAASSVKAQFSEAKEAWANSFKDMLNEAPPIDKLPDAQRMESYIDNLAAQAEGKAPAGVVGALKPCVLMTIKVFMMCEPWSKFVVKWAQVFWDLLPKNVAMMVFGAALCCAPLAQPTRTLRLLTQLLLLLSLRYARACVRRLWRLLRRVHRRCRGVPHDGFRAGQGGDYEVDRVGQARAGGVAQRRRGGFGR